MGNCLNRLSGNCSNCGSVGGEQVEQMIKVVTATGGVMELYAPITAGCITNEFPGHRLFLAGRPLLPCDHLHTGQLYHLLPLSTATPEAAAAAASAATPYRMSFDQHRRPATFQKRSDPDVFPRYNGTGVWKVRLVINPEQLSEILSQDARTEELIESVRTVAKCGGGGAAVSDRDSVAVVKLQCQSIKYRPRLN